MRGAAHAVIAQRVASRGFSARFARHSINRSGGFDVGHQFPLVSVALRLCRSADGAGSAP